MSGRIRSIKPEILDDTVTANLSDMAFRLFVAVIVLADDHGRLRAHPAWLRSQVYWARDVDIKTFNSAMRELVALVRFYEVNGQAYAEIRNWSKHQRVDKPGKPRIPPCGTDSRESREGSESARESLATDLRSPISDLRPPTKDQQPPAVGADEVWDHYVATMAKHRPRRRPTKLTPKDRKAIAGHLASGLTVADLRLAVDGLFRSTHHIGLNDRSTEYLELEYALRKPSQFIALADDMAPVVESIRPPPPEELVDPNSLDAELAKLDARFAS